MLTIDEAINSKYRMRGEVVLSKRDKHRLVGERNSDIGDSALKLKLNYSFPRVHFHKAHPSRRKQTKPQNHMGNQRFVSDTSSGK